MGIWGLEARVRMVQRGEKPEKIFLAFFDNFQNFFGNFYKILPERPILFVAATLNVYSVLALRLECSNVS